MSQGFVADVFSGHIANLMATQDAAGQAVLNGAQRVWPMPAEAGWNGDPLDITSLVQAFDRSSIGQGMEAIVSDAQNSGSSGSVVAFQIQNDYIALRERAFRIRHLTGSRATALAAARKLGLGSPGGVFGNGVARYVQDILRQGGN